ncbi:MAG: hypothetical protein AAGK14_10530 [Verrucomicrobiota bacterium]
MQIRFSLLLPLAAFWLGLAPLAVAEEELRETGGREIEASMKPETGASPSLLDSNPLFQIDELEHTELSTEVKERRKPTNVFELGDVPDFAGDFSMRLEHRPHKMLMLHSEQRLGVQSRSDVDLLWGSTEERYEYVDINGARFEPMEGLNLNARVETRSDIPQGDDDVVLRDNRILEGSYQPWKKGTVTLGLENPSVTNLTEDTTLEHNHVYRAEWRQGIADLPLTATFGSRMLERYDPDAGFGEVASTSPQLSGALDWRPVDDVRLRFGARGEQAEDALGTQLSERRHLFAEYEHRLTDAIGMRSRLGMEEHEHFDAGIFDRQTSRAEIRVGPSWKMSETFNADLELQRSWEDDGGVSGFEPEESRVSFSIRGEF